MDVPYTLLSKGLNKLKLKLKSWFNEECYCFLDSRKQAKLQWVQDPSQSDVDNPNNVRFEASRDFRKKKRKKERKKERKNI